MNGVHLTLVYRNDDASDDPDWLDMTSTPAPGDFTVLVDGTEIAVSTVEIADEESVRLTLSQAVQSGDVITVDYTPGANPIKDLWGNEAIAVNARAVQNDTAASSDATLSALMAHDGTNEVTLDPPFVSGTFAYTADVANAVAAITLTATPTDANGSISTVTLNGSAISDTDFTDAITVASLVEGDNVIALTATAQNGATQIYTVTVPRAAADVAVTIVPNYSTIGTGLEDLIFTLTRTGPTSDILEVTMTIDQEQHWLGDSVLSVPVHFSAGDSTTVRTIPASNMSFDPDASGALTATVTGTGVSGSSTTVSMISTVDPAVTVSYDLTEYTFKEDALATDVNIYVVATVNPVYPRAPNGFNLAIYPTSGTAVFREDYIGLGWILSVTRDDFVLDTDTNTHVARVRVRDGFGNDFGVINDEVYEGSEQFFVQLEPSGDFPHGLVQFVYPDATTCEPAACSPIVQYLVTITDEEDRPVLSLSAAPESISEADDSTTTSLAENVSKLDVAITNAKTFATVQSVTLDFAGTAVYDSDYTVVPVDTDANVPGHQMLFPARATSVRVVVSAVDNADFDGSRTIEVVGSLDDVEFARATIAVTDDEQPNAAPTFVDGATATRSVAENTASGLDFDAPVSARDAEDDVLEYTLDGVDAASFDIDAATGQLRTGADASYDYEEKSSYSVTVAVNDGHGGTDAIAISVDVTDENEPPSAPAAPGVTTVRDSVTSLKVSWQAPDNAGRPPIAHYDVRYQPYGTGRWTNGPQGETGTVATIDNLVENTKYAVQVRAANADGDSAWSISGRGTPGAEQERMGELRLVNDSGPTDDGEGRLEAFYRGRWGTVCDDRFTSANFTVYGPDHRTDPADFQIVPNVAPQLACQLMGYVTGQAVSREHLGMSVAPESQVTWLDDVRCAEGSAVTGLHQCHHAGVGLENCSHAEDVHLRCVAFDDTPQPLTAALQRVPESHIGQEFKFRVAFSEPVSLEEQDLVDGPLVVSGARSLLAANVDGRADLWEVTVRPIEARNVSIGLEDGHACDHTRAVCTRDGRSLSEGVNVSVEGKPRLTASFQDVPASHGGDAFTMFVEFSEELAEGFDLPVASQVLGAANGHFDQIAKSSSNSRRYSITLTPIDPAQPVHVRLKRRHACDLDGAICTPDGRRLSHRIITTVSAGTSMAVQAPPLTAHFANLPDEHDGESAFTVEIVFSEKPAGGLAWGIKNRTVRDALNVTRGTATRVRLADNDPVRRVVTVQPVGHEPVDIALPASRACDRAGAICTEAGGRLENSLLTRVRGPAALRVADAEIHEGPRAKLAFALTLDRATSLTVSVDYATADGTAQAGLDYRAKSGTITFAPGETAKTVKVRVLNDAHDEGSETVTLTLSNVTGAYLEDGVATGTINNSDVMPRGWMTRFGRAVATHIVQGLTQRFDGAGVSHVTVAGIDFAGTTTPDPTLAEADPFRSLEWESGVEREADARSITNADLILRSSFRLSSGSAAIPHGGAAFTTWGQVETGKFEAEEDDVKMDGDVTTGLIGFDAEWKRALAGIMFSTSTGNGSYRLDPAEGDDAGTVESTLTGVYPYVRIALNEKVSAWALVGLGSGELTLRQTGNRPMSTDTSMRMGAAGVKGQLLDGNNPAGVAFNVKTDAMWVATKSDRSPDMIATRGDVTRLRLIVQGERMFEIAAGAVFTPSAEIGLRHDGGDAETGTGLEVGTALRYTVGSVTIEAQARTLLAHRDSAYEEWGLSGALRITPDASARGFALSIAPAWGRTASASQHLWSARDVSTFGEDPQFEADSRLDMQAGYGFGLVRNRGVVTPYTGMRLGDAGHRLLRAGIRWQFSPDAVLGLEGVRETRGVGHAANGVKLRAAFRF